MPSRFRSINELVSLYRYWQRHPLASRDLPGTAACRKLPSWPLCSTRSGPVMPSSALEPVPATFERLARNLRLGDLLSQAT